MARRSHDPASRIVEETIEVKSPSALVGGCVEFDGLRDFWLDQFLGAGRVRLWEVCSWIGARDTLISSFRFLPSFRGCAEHFVQRGPSQVHDETHELLSRVCLHGRNT